MSPTDTKEHRTSRAIGENCAVQKEKFSGPHHPLFCDEDLQLFEDNSLACPHTHVLYNHSIQSCIDYSFALLLIGIACEKFGPEPS